MSFLNPLTSEWSKKNPVNILKEFKVIQKERRLKKDSDPSSWTEENQKIYDQKKEEIMKRYYEAIKLVEEEKIRDAEDSKMKAQYKEIQKDLRNQIKNVKAKIIAIETGIETDEYDTTPSLATPTEFEQPEEEVDDRTIDDLETELKDVNEGLSKANAEKQRQDTEVVDEDEEDEELNEMQKESDNDIILAKDKVCKGITADRAEKNKCLNELIGLLTTRIDNYKTSGVSPILIHLDELILKHSRLSIEYNNKFIKLTELKKKVTTGEADENRTKFNKCLSEAQKILDDKKLIMNEVDNIKKRSDNIKKRSEKKNEVKKFERFRNNPRRPLTNEEKKKLDVHMATIVQTYIYCTVN